MGLAAAAPACGTHSQTQPAWSSHSKSSPGLAQGLRTSHNVRTSLSSTLHIHRQRNTINTSKQQIVPRNYMEHK